MRRAYCTYFDSHYLARGLVMLRSLLEHEPAAEVHVLAFDETCARVLEDRLGHIVRVLRMDTLHARDPGLAARRGTRSAWAFYATHKPALARHLMNAPQAPDSLMYLDADLWFFDSLAATHAEIGEASIGLSPHRFHERTRHLAAYGTYNAGCIYWRNDATARRALDDWRGECLEWCEEKIEPDGRFMNQGYLNRWPERYAGVHVIQAAGVNLAPWNLEGHVVERRGPRVTVDGSPLVFYHFSGLVRAADGWHASLYKLDADRFEPAHEAIYAPYLAALEAERRALGAKYGMAGAVPVRAVPVHRDDIRLRTWPVRFTREPARRLDVPGGRIASFAAQDEAGPQPVTGPFDLERERAGQLSAGEIESDGERYLGDLLPAERLRGARVLETGGGSGRLAKYLSRRAAFIELAQPGDAARVAARTVAGCANVRVVQVEQGELPYAPSAFDVILSAGVLHAVPDSGAEIARLAGHLRPGGLLCLYLRYALDGRPWIHRAAFRAAQGMRAVISRLPEARRRAACDAVAVAVYLPLIGLAAMLRRFAPRRALHERIPLCHCLGQPWPAIRADALERFGRPPERRFTKREIAAMLERAGLCDITFAQTMPRWRVVARKPE